MATVAQLYPEIVEKQIEMAETAREALLITLEMLRLHDPDRAQVALAGLSKNDCSPDRAA